MTNKKILGVYNFLVYLIGCLVSIAFIAIGFIKEEAFKDWAEVFLYVGTGGIGAVVLAYFIELSNNKRDDKNKTQHRSEMLASSKFYLYLLIERMFWAYNRIEIEVLKKRKNENTYKMRLDVFIEKLEKFAKDIDKNSYAFLCSGDDKIISNLLNCTESKIEMFKNQIVLLSDKFRVAEKSEFFSKQEIDELTSVAIVLNDFIYTYSGWATNLYCIKGAFDSLFKIKEFLELKDMMLFYQDKTVSFKVLHNIGISEEDKQNAIELQ